ncbi:MAG: hypothetical protein A3B38_04590 [Candidatus Levybacteria bacterium RIFCSPLOWO2_01_FULL_36_13]|nr:MAG: hypothetical protein A2684_00340 [Candidatus Levybacteria bacterium RIFCSPHIGHO2_01_FULL_36_15b]OGH34105.1 MAG: hypothetical protein A3B38_04590 [Candidatus Levybacteria bacterium RIFCSPLOWO2_01_FULL_36_13]
MKKAAYIIAVVGLLLVINGLIGSIFDLWSKQDVVKEAQRKLEQEKAKNAKLKAEYTLAQKQDFVEKEARNKLFWVKEGEQNVLIPEDLLPKDNEIKAIKQDPYWKQWVNLFL